MLACLDILEDYPAFYNREIQEISAGDAKENCWVYLLTNYSEKLLTLPMLSDYKDSAEKPYLERCQRESNILAKDDLTYE